MKLQFGQFTRWVIADEIGYEPKTTFWNDFDIADWYGVSAIKDTFDRAFNEWKSNIEYLTELALVVNHRAWFHEEDAKYCKAYVECYRAIENYVYGDDSPLSKEERQYYWQVTD